MGDVTPVLLAPVCTRCGSHKREVPYGWICLRCNVFLSWGGWYV